MRRMPPLGRSVLVAAIALTAFVAAPSAAADLADERALAERHAPIVRIVEQTDECGHGEPFIPTDINLILDEPTVALRGPWSRTDLVQIAPSAKDLVNRFEYHLDFPGDPLDAGCDYALWAKRLTAGSEPVVYAHVVTEPERPGKVSLQYWFFYPFNDFNNTHEGDWEMIQLVFDAQDAAEALGRDPVEVGYSAHEGATRSAWDDDKLDVVDGTRPVVYPAAGSHANKYSAALWLGSSAEAGVGCDDTQGPHRELSPGVETIPSDRVAAEAAYPWIAFEGRWGELQKAFCRARVEGAHQAPAEPGAHHHRPRDDPRAHDLRRSPGDLDAGRTHARRQASIVGPDHLGLRAPIRQATAALPRPRCAPDPDRRRDHVLPVAPPAGRGPPRHRHG